MKRLKPEPKTLISMKAQTEIPDTGNPDTEKPGTENPDTEHPDTIATLSIRLD
jgi:hypothetical protein